MEFQVQGDNVIITTERTVSKQDFLKQHQNQLTMLQSQLAKVQADIARIQGVISQLTEE